MIRITRKRLIVTTLVLLLLAGLLVITWRVCDWPPPRLILKYGFPPAGGPTGRRCTVHGIEMIELSSGYFRMGAGLRTSESGLFERVLSLLGLVELVAGQPTVTEPPRWVEVEGPFWLAKTELTIRDYLRLTREAGEPGARALLPVTEVSWDQAMHACRTLSAETHRFEFRLPTEAQWEYAAKAGTGTEYFFGNFPNHLDRYAWFDLEELGSPQPPAMLAPNPWGLFDVYGNVAEWCCDRWHGDYVGAPSDDRPWLTGDTALRVIRGGAGCSGEIECSSNMRLAAPQSMGLRWVGVRLAAREIR